ncbi:hypothetical protein QYF36_004622 [Acer negundo]|nr:hypothetical protein QYF36_004622 [Acer negundo]
MLCLGCLGLSKFDLTFIEVGRFCQDYICLKDLWDSAMHELLGLESVPDECRSYYQSSNSEGGESNNENNENGDEMHNANNDNEDENDGLSNVNKDGISQEVVVNIGSDSDNDVQRDPPNRGTAFIVGVDGRITIEVGQMFRGGSHFKEIIKDYSI